MRKFSEITKEELDKAIVEMLNSLDISGSHAGSYNIYCAIYKEWEKAKEYAAEHQS